MMKNMKGKWHTKDGKVMDLSEMTEKHLENSIAYCSRNRDSTSLYVLLNEKKRREDDIKNPIEQEKDNY